MQWVDGLFGPAGKSLEEEDGGVNTLTLQLMFFTILLIISSTLSHFLSKTRLAKWLPESMVILFVGVVASVILTATETAYPDAERVSINFNAWTFFYGLLPPIIFNSAYHMKREIFYRNCSSISLLAVLGTLISNVVVTFGLYYLIKSSYIKDVNLSFMELVALGSLMSSTDPVATLSIFSALKVELNLFYTIFGESILNDAIAITAFRSANKYIAVEVLESIELENILAGFFVDFLITFFGSCLLGYGLGMVSALWVKSMKYGASEQVATVVLVVAFITLPYYLAEAMGLSGIVTTLFGGIAVRRYTKKNMSAEAHQASSFLFKLLSQIAEMACFLLVGLNVCSLSTLRSIHMTLIAWTFVLILVGRASGVYTLLSGLNVARYLRGGVYESSPSSSPSSTALTVGGLETRTSAVSTSDVCSPLTASAAASALAAEVDPIAILSAEDIAAGSIRPPSLQTMTNPNENPNNHTTTLFLIPFNSMHMIFFAGLRGVVAFACAANFSNANGNLSLVVSSTSAIILVTLVLFGCFTETFIDLLKIPVNVDPVLFLKKLRTIENSAKEIKTGAAASRVISFEETYIYPLLLSSKAKKRSLQRQLELAFTNDELDTSGGGSFVAPHTTEPASVSHAGFGSPESVSSRCHSETFRRPSPQYSSYHSAARFGTWGSEHSSEGFRSPVGHLHAVGHSSASSSRVSTSEGVDLSESQHPLTQDTTHGDESDDGEVDGGRYDASANV